MHPRRRTITALAGLSAACFCTNVLHGQDVEQVAGDLKKSMRDPIRITGSIGASSVLYRSYGIQPRRDPFYWVTNANLTFSVLDKITIPFTMVVTQQDKNFSNGLDKFSQPFNQFGLSPRYRWLTVHAGYRSMEFSEYTLSGVIWLGGGVEIRPGNSLFSASAFYGRFLKAVPRGGVSGVVVSLPSYERRGGGAKLRVGTERSFGEIIFTRIADDPFSIPFDTAVNITPQENQLIGLNARHGFAKWLSLQTEISLSIFTRNVLQESYPVGRVYIDDLFEVRPTTRFNKVINSSIEFTPGRQRFYARYKRVDPDYQSLGALFLTNDVEEISGGSDLATKNGKVSVALAAGVQRNNLDRKQAVSSGRLIGSANIVYSINDHVSLNGTYSNFSSNSVARRNVFSDSIVFVQLTQNGGFNANFSFGNKCRQMFTMMLSYQESAGSQQPLTTVESACGSYNLEIGGSGWGFTLSGLLNRMQNETMGEQLGYGPQVAIQKSMFNRRLLCSAAGGWQHNFLNGSASSENITTSAGILFVIDGHQQMRADGSWLVRESSLVAVQSFSEVRVTLGYSYQFRVSRKSAGKK